MTLHEQMNEYLRFVFKEETLKIFELTPKGKKSLNEIKNDTFV